MTEAFKKKSQCDKDGVHSDVMLTKEGLTNAGCTPTEIREGGSNSQLGFTLPIFWQMFNSFCCFSD